MAVNWILVLCLFAWDCANYSRGNESGNCFSFLGVSFDYYTCLHCVDADLLYCYGCTGIFFMHLAGVKIQKTLKIIVMNFIVFLPAGIIMSIAKIMQVNSTIELILAALLLILYCGYLVKTDSTIRDMVRNWLWRIPFIWR